MKPTTTVPPVARIPPGSDLPHIAFVMEQHLGHQTYSDNLRSMVEDRHDVVVSWVPVEYEKTDRWWERLPAESARAALRGRTEVDDGLRGLDADVCVFNTQVPAVLAGRRARARPYVLCSDVTPRQYDAMAAGYQHRADRAGPLRWLKHRWNLSVFERAAAHAPWSSWVRDSLISEYGIRPEAIEVIPPGVDTASWQPAEHGGDGPMQVLFVGGDFSRKGGDVLLEAMASLPGGHRRGAGGHSLGSRAEGRGGGVPRAEPERPAPA